MESLKVLYKTILVALATIVCFHKTAAIFRCNTPDDLLTGPPKFKPGQLWPHGIVTYELHKGLTPVDIEEIMLAIYDVQDKTCIHFVPRTKNETSYISIQHDDKICGLASHLGRTGGPQFVKFGVLCKRANIMIHEFGHILGLAHEYTRIDRDNYVNFTDCPKEQIPAKNNLETRGHFYDYTSQTTLDCKFCTSGFPTMEGVKYCGMDIQEGLSVLDSDKINDLYDCRECHSHRWLRTEMLTSPEKNSLVSFGKTIDFKNLYLCRTYVTGEIAPGQYDLKNNICVVTYNGTEHLVKKKVQVFTVPDQNARKRYVVSNSKEYLVPVGRSALAETIYAAFFKFDDNLKIHAQMIGKVYANDFCKAYFSVGHVEITKTKFSMLGCF